MRSIINPSLMRADMDKQTFEFATAILDRLDRIAIATEKLAEMQAAYMRAMTESNRTSDRVRPTRPDGGRVR
jgi:hypothetical protein